MLLVLLVQVLVLVLLLVLVLVLMLVLVLVLVSVLLLVLCTVKHLHKLVFAWQVSALAVYVLVFNTTIIKQSTKRTTDAHRQTTI